MVSSSVGTWRPGLAAALRQSANVPRSCHSTLPLVRMPVFHSRIQRSLYLTWCIVDMRDQQPRVQPAQLADSGPLPRMPYQLRVILSVRASKNALAISYPLADDSDGHAFLLRGARCWVTHPLTPSGSVPRKRVWYSPGIVGERSLCLNVVRCSSRTLLTQRAYLHSLLGCKMRVVLSAYGHVGERP
jgi:hypothetical protein